MSITPPPPENERWTADYVSSNGAGAVWTDKARRLVVLAYITAVAMPPVGLVLGIAILTRPAKAVSKHGLWIIGIGLIACVLWVLVINSGLLTSNNNDLGY
jgi:hypothetical protein